MTLVALALVVALAASSFTAGLLAGQRRERAAWWRQVARLANVGPFADPSMPPGVAAGRPKPGAEAAR